MEDNGNKMVGAHVLINCETEQKDSLLDRIGAIENVTEIIDVVGSYDIITKINAYNTKSLMLTIRNQLEKIVNIDSAITLIHTDLQDPIKNKSDKIYQKNKNSKNYDYVCCEQCDLQLPYCYCTCPYCGQWDNCECALFDAVAGG